MTPQDSVYDTFRLISLSTLPRWLLGALLAGVAASVLLAAYGLLRETRPTRRVALIALRAVSALLLGALLLEPGLRQLQTMRIKGRLLVLVDGSRSMAFPLGPAGKGGKSRERAVADWISAHEKAFTALEARYQVEYATFDSGVSTVDLERLKKGVSPVGARTDLLGALVAGAKPAAGNGSGLAAALVLSDGADNVRLASGVGPGEEAALRALGAPVSTILFGEEGLKDLAIARVRVDDFAFVRNQATVDVTIESQGFSGEAVPVTLTHDGQVVASKTIELRPGRQSYPVKFELLPDVTGELIYTVAVPVFPGEAVTDNNRRAFVLKVIRDRVRVLLVCGRPSWDERFLRSLLRQDPNVDLVSFFILRDVRDNPKASEDELSLIPFPTKEIFRTDLHTFDLVILQNFAYRPFSSAVSGLHLESYFPDLKRYVLGGGALLMVGGENSFGEGSYDETPVGEVLPVGSVGLPPATELFSPRLTEEGKRHPVTALAEGGEASARLWAALPAIPGINLVRAKPGARVLLENPLLSTGGANAPVLAVSEEGHGRTMALTTDSSWFWSFPAEGRGLSNRHYERFWNNAIRWLVRDPGLTQVQLEPERRTVAPGQPVALVVRARRSDYAPAIGARLAVELRDAEGGGVVAHGAATAAADGSARIALERVPAGAYRAVAVASEPGGTEIGRAEDAVTVRESGPETEDPLPRPELLRRIAEVTHGSYSARPRTLPDLHAVEPERVEVGRHKDRPLWDSGWPLLALCLTLGSEWWLRRRWGRM